MHAPVDERTRIKLRYVDAVRAWSSEDDDARINVTSIISIALQAASVVLLPLAIMQAVKWRPRRDSAARLLREHLRFANDAIPVMAFPIMVNRVLRAPGDRAAPGLVLASISIDNDPGSKEMTELVGHLLLGDGPGWSAADKAFARTLLDDLQFRAFRRSRLPDSMTNRKEMYVCDLPIIPQLLFGHHISDEHPLIPCLAQPGDSGRIWMIPYWIIAEDRQPSVKEQRAFLAGLATFDELDRSRRSWS